MMDYTLVRSKRRSMCIEVKADGQVVVRGPLRMTKAQAEAFLAAQTNWVEAAKERQRQRALAHPEPTEEEKALLLARAKQELPTLVARYAAQMGVTPTGIKITSAQKRFGSCSGKNSLCFSWRLMAYPLSAIEYVVVHELAHIRHKNHSAAFYTCIAQVLPDYRQREKQLKGG